MHKIRFNFSEAYDYRMVKGFPASIILAARSRPAYNYFSKGKLKTEGNLFQQMLTIVDQLFNRLMHVRHCSVFLLLFKTLVHLGRPAFG
jgi:hypothetical protein